MIHFATEKFNGPLGLLLQLIEREEMDITEINLAKIADQYVVYLKDAKNINPEEMSDFLVIAAKLLFIKSKALLPYLTDDEDEQEIDDLKNQLRMYQDFVRASEKIADLIAQQNFLFIPDWSKNRRRLNLPSFAPPRRLDANRLHQEFLAIVKRCQVVEEPLVEKKLLRKVSIDEIISAIRIALKEGIKFSFSRLIESAQDKTEVIVSFLAVLELVKQREIVFEQLDLFSEIHLIKNNN